MNRQQACLHIARNSADRLAEEISSELPRQVSGAFADADRTLGDAELGDKDTGYDPPAATDAASLLAACAIEGIEALWEGTLGVGPTDELSATALQDAVLAKLRHATAVPPGMGQEEYDNIVAVVAEEIVAAAGRRDIRGRK